MAASVLGGCGCDSDSDDESFVTGGGTAGQLENAAATFGRVYSVIGAIIGIIIALICIIFGVAKLRDPHTGKARGKISKVSTCSKEVSRQNQGVSVSYTCQVDVVYMVANKTYTLKNLEITNSVPLVTGSDVTINYDPKNPASGVHEISPRALGWGLIGFGVLVGGLTTGLAVMTFKSKGFAAGYGALEGASMLARAF